MGLALASNPCAWSVHCYGHVPELPTQVGNPEQAFWDPTFRLCLPLPVFSAGYFAEVVTGGPDPGTGASVGNAS